jgi:hypothetical protein
MAFIELVFGLITYILYETHEGFLTNVGVLRKSNSFAMLEPEMLADLQSSPSLH